MLIDFRLLKKSIEKKYDHYLLNDLEEFSTVAPTTERFAEIIFNELVNICKEQKNAINVNWVEVQETNEAMAIYSKEDL
jgi:6-pyruvoyltetrahydropterin/6-carboxytetrahydropterin synthase